MTAVVHRPLKIALLGAGSVGSQTARQLLDRHAELERRIGGPYELIGIAVRSLNAHRDVPLPQELLTTDAEALIDAADIVIELIGGIEPARQYVERALEQGKDVVTGNKALLAAHQQELFAAGKRGGAETYYEAAVAAAIPIIRPLQDDLIGDRVERIMGIVNGSTNYVLDQIDEHGTSMADALAEAQQLGYLEADPSADVNGWDAAAKATILAGLAFQTLVRRDQVRCEGIADVTAEQIADAKAAGFVVKLLAICERLRTEDGTEAVNARVYPALVPRTHPLAAVHGAKNAVFVDAGLAGDLMFYGAGAGGLETTSAILGDVVLAAKRILTGAPAEYIEFEDNLPVIGIDTVQTRYQITLRVTDVPGVLAQVSQVFADHEVSVRTITQTSAPTAVSPAGAEPELPAEFGTLARLIVVTHVASEQQLQATVAALDALESVHNIEGYLRVEGV